MSNLSPPDGETATTEPATTAKKPTTGFPWMLVLRVATTVGALLFILSRVPLAAVGSALVRVSPYAFLVACISTTLNLVVGSVRWRILLRAYGAPHLPSLGTLTRLNYIGFFYNTCLPGGVGGDLVRGAASQAAFGESGGMGAGAVVLVDRVLGLVGLLLVVAVTATFFPLPGSESAHVTLIALGGVTVSALAVAAIAVGRSLAPMLPVRLAVFAKRLPRIVHWQPFIVAILLSLVTQTGVAWTGHVIVHSLAPSITLLNSLVVVPLAMATTFLPFLVGGTGAREAVFAQLYGPLGVSEPDATAAGLLIWFSQIVVALVGGVLPLPDKPKATVPQDITVPGPDES
jgi:uncharacterized membrane protein YbhN (UPF0104 family)